MDRRISSRIDQKGQVLLVLIAGFVIAAGVGLGMVYLGGTSTYSELLTNNASKAAALAESGIRVAIPWVMQYKKNGTPLDNLDGKKFALGDVGDGTFSIAIDDTPEYTQIQSTGVVNADTFLETRRLITWKLIQGGNAPPYENKNWTGDSLQTGDGSFATVTVGGDSALRVTGTGTGGSFKQNAIQAFNPQSTSSPDFQGIWQTGGNLLSYRVQVKVLDSPSDNQYMAGISFRVTDATNLTGSLGVSLFRSSRGSEKTYGIPDSLVPQYCWPWWPDFCQYLNNAAILLLWTQTNQGSGGRVPLAYRIVDLGWISLPWFYFSNDLYVVNASDHLLPWVTLLVSVEEKQLETGRVNDIKVYVGNVQTDHGANDTPLDPTDSAVRLKHDRGQIDWPPVDVNQTTTSNDRFTLVQWTAVDNRVQVMGSGKELDGIIRTSLATTSSSSYDTSRPEIALVTFGEDTGPNAFVQHIYFDDFAVDFPFSSGSGSRIVQY
jgi:hypothetical protein